MVGAIKDAGFNVSRTLFAPVCLVSLLSSYNIPDKFLFLDFGAGLTTFGLASGGRLVKSQVLNYGSEDLTHALMNKFHLSYDRADYLKKSMDFLIILISNLLLKKDLKFKILKIH